MASVKGDRTAIGRRAEDAVARRLEGRGFQIVARNERVGRLEIDIIARRGPLLIVCEVRSRSSKAFGSPALTVDRGKIQRLRAATRRWLSENRPGTRELRFDVAAVVFGPTGEPEIDYFERAF